jgi:hypothetical protein
VRQVTDRFIQIPQCDARWFTGIQTRRIAGLHVGSASTLPQTEREPRALLVCDRSLGACSHAAAAPHHAKLQAQRASASLTILGETLAHSCLSLISRCSDHATGLKLYARNYTNVDSWSTHTYLITFASLYLSCDCERPWRCE